MGVAGYRGKLGTKVAGQAGAAINTAGGTYTLDGNTYKEKVEVGRFGSPRLLETVGKDQTSNLNLDGDTLIVEGTLSNGMKLREIWKRVR